MPHKMQHAHAHGGGHAAPPHKYPFLWGAQKQEKQIAAINVTPGMKVPTTKVDKAGFLLALDFRFAGSINVTTAGTSATPRLERLISSYILSYNGGFQYRNQSSETMYVMDLVRNAGPDMVKGAPDWKNYAPQTTGAQAIGFTIRDYVGLNLQANADKYLLAAHSRSADVTIDLTFNANPNADGVTNPLYSIAANTEIGVISGTLYIEAIYLLDPPNYHDFHLPDLDRVQTIDEDTSFTQVVTGKNVVSILPLNGPKYLQVLFQVVANGAPDTQGASSIVTGVNLKINNGLNRIETSSQTLARRNATQLQRYQVGTLAAPTNAALPPGWYLLDFLNDVSINNVMSEVGRDVISTEDIASLWIEVYIANGTNLTANNWVRLIKRTDLPAVGGTSKLVSPNVEHALRSGGR